jgi:hypothetical protein
LSGTAAATVAHSAAAAQTHRQQKQSRVHEAVLRLLPPGSAIIAAPSLVVTIDYDIPVLGARIGQGSVVVIETFEYVGHVVPAAEGVDVFSTAKDGRMDHSIHAHVSKDFLILFETHYHI